MNSSLKKRSCVNREFKSPLISRVSGHGGRGQTTGDSPSLPQPSEGVKSDLSRSQSMDDDEKILQKDVERLREELKLKDTEKEIQQLKEGGIKESELSEYINKLHEYNDLKDTGQMVIGNIASVQGVRTRDLYPKYGLELDD